MPEKKQESETARWTCPKCGDLNESKAAFCATCGNPRPTEKK